MIFYAYHGINEYERQKGQRYEVDVQMWLDLSKAGHLDQLEHTVDVREVNEVTKEIVIEGEFNLVEAMATHLAEVLLDRFNINKVTVTVCKPYASLEGITNGFEVEVTREN